MNVILDESLMNIVLRHCFKEIDMSMFKNAPKSYMCNLQQLSQELLTKGRSKEILYEKNRRPGETDPMRVTNIVNYQLSNRSYNADNNEYLYDTADWKITFATINNNPNTIRIIDGGHRITASVDIENIYSIIQILDFPSEEERFEKFRLINISSDLPEIYRLSSDDLYKNLCDSLKIKVRNEGWFVQNNYSFNTKSGVSYNLPYLVEGEFSNIILKYKTEIFGNFSELSETIDMVIDKVMYKLKFINQELIIQITEKFFRQAKFSKAENLYTDNIKICLGYNSSKKSRCTHPAKTKPGVCGFHTNSGLKFSIPTFDEIIEEIKRSKCAIGLLNECELINKYKNVQLSSLI